MLEIAKKVCQPWYLSPSFNEDLRRVMEPRTTTAKQKLKAINELSGAGVRMGIMMGPMIPGLNEHEMQRIMKAAETMARPFTAYTFIRLNRGYQIVVIYSVTGCIKTLDDRADRSGIDRGK